MLLLHLASSENLLSTRKNNQVANFSFWATYESFRLIQKHTKLHHSAACNSPRSSGYFHPHWAGRKGKEGRKDTKGTTESITASMHVTSWPLVVQRQSCNKAQTCRGWSAGWYRRTWWSFVKIENCLMFQYVSCLYMFHSAQALTNSENIGKHILSFQFSWQR